MRKYIGGKKVEQYPQESDMGYVSPRYGYAHPRRPPIEAPINYETITVPIERANGYTAMLSVDEDIPRSIIAEELVRVMNEVLQRFLEANQDKILLDTIHFDGSFDPANGGYTITIPRIRAISIEHGDYMEQVRTIRRETHASTIVFPRLITSH